ncbi:Hypothetical protein D9617_41g062640 [Elsinoe fawcettii]|nr:Hypothetical protein D9617_41g062640 [Elsinoe fawcettii]
MSRFVSGGTTEQPTERSEEWLKAQQAIEAKKVEKLAQSRQEEGKSLYDTLQANKAAKQDAFEESIRLKNQFRSLDEDEIDFLESVNATTRAKENAVKKETTEQLSAFREQQQKSENRKPESQDAPIAPESWTIKKRKREKTTGLPGVKVRRTSSAADAEPASTTLAAKQTKATSDTAVAVTPSADRNHTMESVSQSTPEVSVAKPSSPKVASSGLGLGAYSSDED